ADKEQINEWWSKHPEAGVAIVTGAISGLSVVDIDTAEGEKLFKEKIGEVKCPTALTPGGGKHLYFQDFGASNKTGFIPGVDFRGEGGYIIAPPSPGPNGSDKMYAWAKGCRITEVPPPPAPLTLLVIKNNTYSLYSKELSTKKDATEGQQCATIRNIDFSDGTRDETMFHLAYCCLKGGMPRQEIEQLLLVIAQRACVPPIEESIIPVKIKSAMDRILKKDRNLTQEVRELISATQGTISASFIQKEQQIATKEDKHKLRTILSRLVQEGIIEQTKRVAGEYRIVNKQYEVVDLMKINEGNTADVVLPFGIGDLVGIYPKDMIVYAGAPNTGKTALMLETVRLNMNNWKCWYFSTEMGRFNARDRIGKHETCKDWNFNFIDDVPNYLDILHPDDLNFIDYLETDAEGKYFMIAGMLGAIQKRMRNGVVFVALQKKTGANWALGGEQTKAKAALFCGIDSDYPGAIMRLEKAKNFKGVNPNGHCIKFSIRGGINVEERGVWQPEY
ncbi:MAG: bifunctional DNA primase/polymerase, partial [Magnetococcus sp. WYHC-3]